MQVECPQRSLTRDVFPQIPRLDFGYNGLFIERVIVVADAINGLVASFPESEEKAISYRYSVVARRQRLAVRCPFEPESNGE